MDQIMTEQRRLAVENRSTENTGGTDNKTSSSDFDESQENWDMKTNVGSEYDPYTQRQNPQQNVQRGARDPFYRTVGASGQGRGMGILSRIYKQQERESQANLVANFKKGSLETFTLGGRGTRNNAYEDSTLVQSTDIEEQSGEDQETSMEETSAEDNASSWDSQELWDQIQWEFGEESSLSTDTQDTEYSMEDAPTNLKMRESPEEESQPSDTQPKQKEEEPQVEYFADDESSPKIRSPESSSFDDSSHIQLNPVLNESRLPSKLTHYGPVDEPEHIQSSSASSSDLSTFCKDRIQGAKEWFDSQSVPDKFQRSKREATGTTSLGTTSDQRLADLMKFLEQEDILEPMQAATEKAVKKLFRLPIPGGGDTLDSSESGSFTYTMSEFLTANQSSEAETSLSDSQSNLVTPSQEQPPRSNLPQQSTTKTTTPEQNDMNYHVRESISPSSKTLHITSKKTAEIDSILCPPFTYAKLTSSSSYPDFTLQGTGKVAKKTNSFCSSTFTSQGGTDFMTSMSQGTSPAIHISPPSTRHNKFVDFLQEKTVFDALQKVVEKATGKLAVKDKGGKISLDTSTTSSSFKLLSPIYAMHAMRDGKPSGAGAAPRPKLPSQPPGSGLPSDAAKADKLKKDIKNVSPVPSTSKHSAKPTTSKSMLEKMKADIQKHTSLMDSSTVITEKTPNPQQETSPLSKGREDIRQNVAPVEIRHSQQAQTDSETEETSMAEAKADSQLTASLSTSISTLGHDTRSRPRQKTSTTHIKSTTKTKQSVSPTNDQKVSLASPTKTKPKLFIRGHGQPKPTTLLPYQTSHPPKSKQKTSSLESVSTKASNQASKSSKSKGLASIVRKPNTSECEAISRWLSLPGKLGSNSTCSSLSTLASSKTCRQYTREEIVECLMENAVSLMVFKYKTEKKLASKIGFISKPFTDIYNRRMAECTAPNAKLRWPITLEPLTRHEEGCLASHPHWAATKGERVQLPWEPSTNTPQGTSKDGPSIHAKRKGHPYPPVASTSKGVPNHQSVKPPHSLRGKKTLNPLLPKVF